MKREHYNAQDHFCAARQRKKNPTFKSAGCGTPSSLVRMAIKLEGAAGGGAARPGPLEIKTTEMAGNVDNFADKK